MRRSVRLGFGAALLVLAAGCQRDTDGVPGPTSPFPLQVPPGHPVPPMNEEVPLTTESVQLGKALFFEPGLSRGGEVSCGSCHFPARAFSDTVAISLGVQGRPGRRNSPTLANVAHHPAFFKDGGVPTLEMQVLAPIHDPVEMDFDIHEAALLLKDEEPYRSLSRKAFGRDLDAGVITRAIANYERTLLSGWSRYDRFLQGDVYALSQAEQRGLQVFNGPEANCSACHNGFDLSDRSYRNIGLYAVYEDEGRGRITLDPADDGKFMVPTLRNIALTAPYMHDGSMTTLDEVIHHFMSGGVGHPNQSPAVRPFTLSSQERSDLLEFLGSLTDERPIDQVP